MLGYYNVTVSSADGSSTRSFIAKRGLNTWDGTYEPCLFVGNSQAGPTLETQNYDDSIIEGTYTDYIVSSLFDTNFIYSQWGNGC